MNDTHRCEHSAACIDLRSQRAGHWLRGLRAGLPRRLVGVRHDELGVTAGAHRRPRLLQRDLRAGVGQALALQPTDGHGSARTHSALLSAFFGNLDLPGSRAPGPPLKWCTGPIGEGGAAAPVDAAGRFRSQARRRSPQARRRSGSCPRTQCPGWSPARSAGPGCGRSGSSRLCPRSAGTEPTRPSARATHKAATSHPPTDAPSLNGRRLPFCGLVVGRAGWRWRGASPWR